MAAVCPPTDPTGGRDLGAVLQPATKWPHGRLCHTLMLLLLLLLLLLPSPLSLQTFVGDKTQIHPFALNLDLHLQCLSEKYLKC